MGEQWPWQENEYGEWLVPGFLMTKDVMPNYEQKLSERDYLLVAAWDSAWQVQWDRSVCRHCTIVYQDGVDRMDCCFLRQIGQHDHDFEPMEYTDPVWSDPDCLRRLAVVR